MSRGATAAAAWAEAHSDADASPRATRRARILLALAVAAGAALGVLAALRGGALAASPTPASAIAVVGDRAIAQAEYARALELFAGDRREPLGASERAHVLRRLIDEELLVQHALASGLLGSDRAVRDAVVRAMVETAVADAASRAPSEAELRALHRDAPTRQPLAAPAPAFESVRAELESAWLERAREQALHAYLAELHARAQLVLPPQGHP